MFPRNECNRQSDRLPFYPDEFLKQSGLLGGKLIHFLENYLVLMREGKIYNSIIITITKFMFLFESSCISFCFKENFRLLKTVEFSNLVNCYCLVDTLVRRKSLKSFLKSFSINRESLLSLLFPPGKTGVE